MGMRQWVYNMVGIRHKPFSLDIAYLTTTLHDPSTYVIRNSLREAFIVGFETSNQPHYRWPPRSRLQVVYLHMLITAFAVMSMCAKKGSDNITNLFQ